MRRAAAVLLGCVLLAGCGQVPTTSSTAGALLAPDAVPQDGDTVSGSGRVVQEPGGPVLFCGNEFIAQPGYEPGDEPAPVACRDGIPLEGADLAALAERVEKAGAVEGHATVTGLWRDGTVEVTEQGPPARPGPGPSGLREVPCPEPPGGWPVTSQGDNMDAEMALVHQSGRVRVAPGRFAMLRPSPDQVLLGYAVPDEEARVQAQAALDELVPDRACVVVARHSDAQVDAARTADWSRFPGVRGHGVGLSHLQAVLDVWVLVVTGPMAAEAARHPQGLVQLLPDLRVVAPADRLEPPQEASATPSPTASPSPAVEPDTTAAGPSPAAGRIESLDCGGDLRSVSLSVDHTADAAGHPSPEVAAHVLADNQRFPRDRYAERSAEDPAGQPVVEYVTDDGRVVAFVTVDRWAGDSWMGSGLTVCQSAYDAG